MRNKRKRTKETHEKVILEMVLHILKELPTKSGFQAPLPAQTHRVKGKRATHGLLHSIF